MLARVIAESVQLDLEELISELSEVAEALTGLPEASDPTVLREALVAVQGRQRPERAAVLDADGTILNFWPFRPPNSAIQGPDTLWSRSEWDGHAVYFSPRSAGPMSRNVGAVSVAIEFAGGASAPARFLVAEYTLTTWKALLERIPMVGARQLYLLDRDDTVLATNDRHRTHDIPFHSHLIRDDPQRYGAQEVHDSKMDHDDLVAFARLPDSGWKAVVVDPMNAQSESWYMHVTDALPALVVTFGGLGIIAIAWARTQHRFNTALEQERQRITIANAELEARVLQRTIDLKQLNTSLELEVSERQRAVVALARSEMHYRLLFQANPNCMLIYDRETTSVLEVNDAAMAQFGYSHDKFVGMQLPDLHPVEMHDKVLASVQNLPGVLRRPGVLQYVRKDGTLFDGEIVTHDMDFMGRAARLVLCRDVTEQRRAEEALKKSEERYRISLRMAPVGIIISRNQTLRFVNDYMLRLVGLSDESEQLVGKGVFEAIPPPFHHIVQEIIDAPPTMTNPLPYVERQVTHSDGTTSDIEVACGVIEYEGVQAVIATVRDVTEKKRSIAALRQSEERFRIVAKATNDAVWDWDLITDIVWWSDAARILFGYEVGQQHKVGGSWVDNIHPADRDRVLNGMQIATATGGEHWSDEYRFRRADNTYAHVLDRAFIIRDGEGNPIRYIGAMMDVTQQRNLERQLIAAQKMEGIGRLAGGVAHDFNNILTAIKGYAELALQDLEPGSGLYNDIAEVNLAANRASDLTRQLLSFARKQIIDPQTLDLGDLVRGLDKLLRRLIGEDIELVTRITDAPSLVCADPGQIEQVIVNLAVNARDAMPEGGSLCIEVSIMEADGIYSRNHLGVNPGQYVLLSVTDSGTGMDTETQSHIFEPFFTTKEQGKGTGLGLPTSYGIVQQAGGHIWVYSEPGNGSTFKVLLPLATEAPLKAHEASITDHASSEGDETILLVEDETQVRELAARALRARGYHVLTAENGDDAMKYADEYDGDIELLITDLVMPKMGGKELSIQLTRLRPNLSTLFTSEYTEESITTNGILNSGVSFLSKPFNPISLLTKVRTILDSNGVL